MIPAQSVLADFNQPTPNSTPAHNGHAKRKPASHPGGPWETFNTFFDHTTKRLKPTEAVVWFELFRNARKGFVTRSLKQIAGDTGLKAHCVQYAIDRLIEIGEVERAKRGAISKAQVGTGSQAWACRLFHARACRLPSMEQEARRTTLLALLWGSSAPLALH